MQHKSDEYILEYFICLNKYRTNFIFYSYEHISLKLLSGLKDNFNFLIPDVKTITKHIST